MCNVMWEALFVVSVLKHRTNAAVVRMRTDNAVPGGGLSQHASNVCELRHAYTMRRLHSYADVDPMQKQLSSSSRTLSGRAHETTAPHGHRVSGSGQQEANSHGHVGAVVAHGHGQQGAHAGLQQSPLLLSKEDNKQRHGGGAGLASTPEELPGTEAVIAAAESGEAAAARPAAGMPSDFVTLTEVRQLKDHKQASQIQRDGLHQPQAHRQSNTGEEAPAPAAAETKQAVQHQGTTDTLNDQHNTYEDLDMATFSPPRRAVAKICANPDFELIVVVIIFANIVVLALQRPTEPDTTRWNRTLFWIGKQLRLWCSCQLRVMQGF